LVLHLQLFLVISYNYGAWALIQIPSENDGLYEEVELDLEKVSLRFLIIEFNIFNHKKRRAPSAWRFLKSCY